MINPRKVSLTSRFPSSSAHRKITCLKSTPSNAILAASGLLVSTIVGSFSEQSIPNSGILSTLISSAILSNLGWIPPTHALYDWCWSVVLPASLALLLLQEEVQSAATGDLSNKPSGMLAVGLAFGVASIASMIGCTTSFLVCRSFSSLWLPPANAAVAGGCLCASYIGGSINFFSAARLLHAKSSLLSAMAAADLLVMAVYFAWLVAALQNRRLLKWFGDSEGGTASLSETAAATTELSTPAPNELSSSNRTESVSLPTKISASVLVSLLAWSMATLANHVERILNPIVSGTSCAIICLLATIVQRFIMPSMTTKLGSSHPKRFWNTMRQMATPLGAFSFQLFFAAVGISANLGQALQAGPASLWFSATALGIHMLVTLGGCLGWNRLLRMRSPESKHRLQLKHVLVASNAAIGGPATAAAYAGQQQTGLTVAATVWGVVGYGVGTSLGVALSRIYQGW
eukprot:CAMPEP_0119031000 /NCGR_PEP_ID=MMETSP1176-20130426/41315_1 /TAXON_ID=265551 /ORGANISM="Synedropsis recta cf, Strain CCMP1620" /LENGTH=459 /DNA_ID=CAMNT_0006987381 /DNA_START=971 /DNA_END=2347 /DNA_ORIENTATION=-